MRPWVIATSGVIAVVSATSAGLGWTYHRWFETPVDPEAELVEFEVAPGATGARVGRELAARSLIHDARAWRLWLRMRPEPEPKAGRHRVSAAWTLPQIHQTLGENPLPEDEPFTVLEGWRRVDTDRALADSGWAPAGAYLEATASAAGMDLPFEVSTTLEGYLYPETYRLVRADFEVRDLVSRQIATFVERFYEPYVDDIRESGRSLADIVKMASMLEREEPTPELRPKVAGVLYKRLDNDVALGVDATSRYRLSVWNDRKAFLKKLRDPADEYNTRLHTGLPPTAIGAPSLKSLVAALHPERSAYWYYLHDANQRIHFARTAEEHEANRRRYNVW